MQWKEDTTADSRMSTGRSAYSIRTTTFNTFAKHEEMILLALFFLLANLLKICGKNF